MDPTWRLLSMEDITWRRFPSCWWLLVIYTVLTVTSPTLQNSPTSRLLLQSGSTLELNCSLPVDELLQGHNASDIRFRFKDQDWPGEQVWVVDESTVRLQVPGANRTLTGLWSCVLPGREQPLRQQAVIIADLPVKPNITGCVVYNWESMTCTWEPKQQDTGIPTNQTLYWTLLSETFYCPYQTGNECKWKASIKEKQNILRMGMVYAVIVAANNLLGEAWTKYEHYNTTRIGDNFCVWLRDEAERKDSLKLVDMTYYVFVMAESGLGRVNSDLWKYEIQQIVKPNPVELIPGTDKGPYHVLLEWTAPASKPILYKVQHRRQGSRTWKEFNVTTTHAEISDLLPNRNYTFRISGIPSIPSIVDSVTGFWSDAVDTTILTAASVPTAAPAISPGGFRTSDDQHNTQKRKAHIFWKSIPEEQKNGVIETYRIRYRAVHSDTWKSKNSTDRSKRMVEVSLDKDKAYHVVIDAATKAGFNQSLANTLTPIYIAQRDQVPPKPRKLAVVSVEENLVEMNWTAVEGAVGYTVFWCQGSAQFRICNDELDWISVDENTTSYNVVNLGGYQPKQFIFGISAETAFVDDIQQDISRRERRSATAVVSSGIKWSDCTHSSSKPVRGPQEVKFSEHQDPETITIEWTHPKCGESAYIDEYLVSYCQVSNCPVSVEDPANAEVVRVPVDNELEEWRLVGLTPLVEYRVWVQSHSPDKGLSDLTDGQQITVQPSGLSKGVIAILCIVGIIVAFFIIFGFYQTVKRTCRTVKENTTLKVELPPDVGNTFSDRDFPDRLDENYMQTYNTLLAVEAQEKDSKGSPRPPNGTQGRGYFTNGLSRSRDTSYGMGVSGGSTSSNDTMLTLLQHPSADSLDEVFDSGLGGSICQDQSVSSGLRLTPVPEETNGSDGNAGWHGAGQNYDSQTSGTSRHSNATIPGYSRCGLPDNEVTELTDEEAPAVTSTTQTPVTTSPTGNHSGDKILQPDNAGLSPKVLSHSAAARVQTAVAAGHTSPAHHPVGAGQPTEEPLSTEGLATMAEASNTPITPGGSVSLPGGGYLEEPLTNPAAAAAAAAAAGEADYSIVNTGGTASPSPCMSGASSGSPLTYSPQNVSAESPPLPNSTYKRPNLGPGEGTGAEYKHDLCHMGVVPAVKSAARNNNNGYVTVSM